MSRRQEKKEVRRLAKAQAKAAAEARRLAAEAEAYRVAAARDREIDAKLQRFRGVRARNAELEQSILEAPDDQGRWAVYIDWLQSKGDIRGELAAREMYGASGLPSFEVSTETIWSRMREELWDSFGEQFPSCRDRRDFEWQYGFIKTATLHRSASASMSSLVSSLLGSWCGRFLRTLVLIEHEPVQLMEPVVEALADCPTLDALYFFHGLDWVIDQARLFETVPSLKTLYVADNAILRGTAPNLTNLRIDPHPPQEVPPLTFLGWSSFPALQRLELRASQHIYPFVYALCIFLEREDVPQLRHLTILDAGADQLEAVFKTPAIRRLEILDISLRNEQEVEGFVALAGLLATAPKRVRISRTGLIGPNALRAIREALPRFEYLEGDPGIELPRIGK